MSELFPDEATVETDRSLGENCGVFGVYLQSPGANVVEMSLRAAHNQQHRGQEASGVSVADGTEIRRHVGAGLVNVVFSDQQIITDLGEGFIASSHVRYGTIGEADPQKVAQPIERQDFTVAHNGHWQPWVIDELGIENGPNMSDTSRAADFIAQTHENQGATSMEATLQQALPDLLPGAFTLVITTKDQLFAIRDPYGFRPLYLGKNADGYAVASETTALSVNGFEIKRDIRPGEMLVIDEAGIRPTWPFKEQEASENLCSLELAYFTQPAGEIGEIAAVEYRKALGRALASQDMFNNPDFEVDVVTAIPESGRHAAQGYAVESGFIYSDAFQKNSYSGRIFIRPASQDRRTGVRQKLTPFRSVVDGKRVLAVDDSVVRGDTSSEIVQMLYDSGAIEVHIRSTMPPITDGCYQGMDTYGHGELLAARNGSDLEAMRREIGATSIGYLDLKTMEQIMSLGDDRFLRNAIGKKAVGLCTSCMTGEYPIEIR